MPEVGEQVAALPLRRDDKGNFKVLMVTSRDSGRWVVPKGWEMDGKKPWAAAAIEALEEAGAKGHISQDCLGTYRYPKTLADGRIIPCVVRVYPMVVDKLQSDWKERKDRRRKWFSLKGAAKRVDEQELADLLLALGSKPAKEPIIRDLLNKAS